MTKHQNVAGLLKKIAEISRCPGCDCRFADINSFPAWSRYDHGDLCSDCGGREAFERDFIRDRIVNRLALTK